MKRRVVSLFLTTTMLAMTVLSGCGKGSTAASDGSADGNLEDFYEITYTGYWSDDTYEDESYVENMLEDALNIELEVVTTDNSNLDSLLATGQMPDCMWCDKEVAFMQDQ